MKRLNSSNCSFNQFLSCLHRQIYLSGLNQFHYKKSFWPANVIMVFLTQTTRVLQAYGQCHGRTCLGLLDQLLKHACSATEVKSCNIGLSVGCGSNKGPYGDCMAVHLHTQLAGSPLTLLIISYECGNVFLFVVFSFWGGGGCPCILTNISQCLFEMLWYLFIV